MTWTGNVRVETRTRLGFGLLTRPALCDETVVAEVIDRDCYRVAHTKLRDVTVLDCGGHIGVFAAMCAHAGALVTTVEPQPENLELLHLNVAAWPTVTVIAKAVGAHSGMTRIAGESGGAHTGPEGIPVEQTTLADLIDLIGQVDVLKLDMEGGEIEAVLACDHDHLDRVRRIVMESHGPKICPWVDRPHVGDIAEHLLYTHDVELSGFPSHLGYLFATRNSR